MPRPREEFTVAGITFRADPDGRPWLTAEEFAEVRASYWGAGDRWERVRIVIGAAGAWMPVETAPAWYWFFVSRGLWEQYHFAFMWSRWGHARPWWLRWFGRRQADELERLLAGAAELARIVGEKYRGPEGELTDNPHDFLAHTGTARQMLVERVLRETDCNPYDPELRARAAAWVDASRWIWDVRGYAFGTGLRGIITTVAARTRDEACDLAAQKRGFRDRHHGRGLGLFTFNSPWLGKAIVGDWRD